MVCAIDGYLTLGWFFVPLPLGSSVGALGQALCPAPMGGTAPGRGCWFALLHSLCCSSSGWITFTSQQISCWDAGDALYAS